MRLNRRFYTLLFMVTTLVIFYMSNMYDWPSNIFGGFIGGFLIHYTYKVMIPITQSLLMRALLVSVVIILVSAGITMAEDSSTLDLLILFASPVAGVLMADKLAGSGIKALGHDSDRGGMPWRR